MRSSRSQIDRARTDPERLFLHKRYNILDGARSKEVHLWTAENISSMTLKPTPALAVDIVVFNARGQLLLVKRASAPCKGLYALPGGSVEIGEQVEAACKRVLKKDTGVDAGKDLMYFGIFDDPKRDPRGHVVSIGYLVLVDIAEAKAGADAAAVEWVKDFAALDLAFDHNKIVADAVQVLMSMRKP